MSWLDVLGGFATGAVLFAVGCAVAIWPPSRRHRESQLLAAESAVRAQVDLHGACPEPIMYEYTHQAAEYALVLEAGKDRASKRGILLALMGLTATSLFVFALLALLADAGYEHSVWWYIWYAATGLALPLQGLLARRWSLRADQHDQYELELNGPNAEESENAVSVRQNQTAGLELLSFLAVVVLAAVTVASEDNHLSQAISSAGVMALFCTNTYLADSGRAIKSLVR